MAEKFTIRIESILGGHSPTTHFAAEDQFRNSFGIDPGLPIDDISEQGSGGVYTASGLLRPVSCFNLGSTSTLSNEPLWIVDNPKTSTYYVYDSGGSVYTIDSALSSVSGLSDLNDGGSANGNGAAYYDNYIYFARDTTVARYGPLNGTAAFTDDYWVSTLSKTALTHTTYPNDFGFGVTYPNHVMHRHSDGKLYIADVVDNKGTIHFIATTKGTVEGDTDNGSTYNKVQVGYGLWPMAMESYGSDLAIAFIEGTANGISQKGKIAFWDTTSQNVNKITWVEFPDPLITALKNINGVLYVVSGNFNASGHRISRFVGGYTFEDIYYNGAGEPPMAGAIDGDGKRLLFGSYDDTTSSYSTITPGVVYSYGLQQGNLGNGVFSVMRTYDESAKVTALKVVRSNQIFPKSMSYNVPILGRTSSGKGAIDKQNSSTYDRAKSLWWSQMYKIGQPFKITKIAISTVQQINSNMVITPKIYTDGYWPDGSNYTLQTINNTNYPDKQRFIFRSDSSGQPITGVNNFWLELIWSGSELCVVNLPITIEYELIDD